MVRRQSSATWLLLAYLALVVYASLYPFWPWRWPPGLTLEGLLSLPWPKDSGSFDMQANLAVYIPLCFLACASALSRGLGIRGAMPLALLPWTLVSLLMETLQSFLTGRVPS